MQNSRSLSFLFLLWTGYAAAQLTSSPWSERGIGDRPFADHGYFSGIGNCSVSAYDSTILNFYNPSTYNYLSKGMPLYSIALNARYTGTSYNGNKDWNLSVVPDHFVMGFGLKKYFGIAFGLKPFTRMGYEITERTKVGTDSMKYVYKGKGGGQEFFAGFSTDLIRLTSTRLSVGGNFGYLFGTAHKERQSYLITGTNMIGGVDWNEVKLNSIHYEFAASFQQKISKQQRLFISAVIEPAQQLNAISNAYLFYGNVDDPQLLDTLSASTNVKTTVQLSGKAQYGLSYKLTFKDGRRDNSLRNSELSFHVNYTKTSVSNVTQDVITVQSPQGWNFGLQYTPEVGFQDNSTNTKFIEKLHYRSGYYQLTQPYRLNDLPVYDKGFSVGLGLPITSFRTLSSINIAFKAGERSNTSTTDFKERYIGFSFGITLSPSNFDKWFVKRKLD